MWQLAIPTGNTPDSDRPCHSLSVTRLIDRSSLRWDLSATVTTERTTTLRLLTGVRLHPLPVRPASAKMEIVTPVTAGSDHVAVGASGAMFLDGTEETAGGRAGWDSRPTRSGAWLVSGYVLIVLSDVDSTGDDQTIESINNRQPRLDVISCMRSSTESMILTASSRGGSSGNSRSQSFQIVRQTLFGFCPGRYSATYSRNTRLKVAPLRRPPRSLGIALSLTWRGRPGAPAAASA
jgi:hypothetical protein